MLHSSFWPGKDVPVLHSTWENLTWDFPLKQPLVWLPGFSVRSCESLQKRAVANILNHSANNNTCNVLREKAAGMTMKEEVGKKKETTYLEQIPFLKLELRF